ncbi:hypothetical protein P7C73_g3857, partial [Tremellales sp. Uapishka_1]
MSHSSTDEKDVSEISTRLATELIKEHPHGADSLEVEEYGEYLALNEVFQGKKLTKMTVRGRFPFILHARSSVTKRKVDWHVLPILIWIYLLSYCDRGNVGNAKLFGATKDLHMTSQQWNTGLTLLFVTYALGAPVSNLLVKRFGPRAVMPSSATLVGVVLLCAGLVKTKPQWYATRLLLGLVESAMYPACTYTLTTWYTPAQIQSRMSVFYLGGVFSGAFSGLLAFGIGQLDYTRGWRGWRWIFVIEGAFTAAVGIASYFLVQGNPATQGRWLSAEESRFITLRSKYQYGDSHVGTSDKFTMAAFWAACRSFHTWILSFGFVCITLSIYGLSLSLPTIVLNMGFSAGRAQALSAPPYVFAVFSTVFAGWLADRFRTRAFLVFGFGLMGFIGLLIAVLTVAHKHLVALSYVGVCLGAMGLYPLVPAFTAWIGLNSAGPTKRAAAMGIVVFFGNAGGIAGSNIYIANQAPTYKVGFGTSLAATGVGALLVPIVYWFVIGRINKKRENMSVDEISAQYSTEELQEMGDLSPLYRYER